MEKKKKTDLKKVKIIVISRVKLNSILFFKNKILKFEKHQLPHNKENFPKICVIEF